MCLINTTTCSDSDHRTDCIHARHVSTPIYLGNPTRVSSTRNSSDHIGFDVTESESAPDERGNEAHLVYHDIKKLKPVFKRRYISAKTMHSRNTRAFLEFLKKHKTLHWLNDIHQATMLSIPTIRKWHHLLQEDEHWAPFTKRTLRKQRVFDDTLEDSIMTHIKTNFLDKGLQFNDRMCRIIASTFWEKYKANHSRVTKFTASYNWVRRFKERHRMSTRKAHYQRRPPKTPAYIAECKKFLRDMRQLYAEHERNDTLHLLVNVDETSWKTYPLGEMTWAAKGAEHVEFTSVFNDKECITAIAAITADVEVDKLPLCLIRQGKTDEVKQVFTNLQHFFQILISDSGWCTEECFAQYLVWIRKELDSRYQGRDGYSDTTTINMILDIYPTHCTDQIKAVAQQLHIQLFYFPAGATDIFQPLDRYVFGALKNMAHAMYYENYVRYPKKQFTILDSSLILVKCWANISSSTIGKAWYLYKQAHEDEYDCLNRIGLFDKVYSGDHPTIDDSDFSTYGRSFFQKTFLESDHEDNEKEDHHIVDDEINDDDSDDEEEEYICSDTQEVERDGYIDLQHLPLTVIDALRDFEADEVSRSRNSKTSFKMIKNHNNTCYFNTTLQLLAQIPNLRNSIAQYIGINGDEARDEVYVIGESLVQYDSAVSELEEYPLEITGNFVMDIAENLDTVLRRLGNYGIQFARYNIVTLSVVVNEDDEQSLPLDTIIQNTVGEQQFKIKTALFFHKRPEAQYEFPQMFKFREYFMFLKAVAVNIENHHFYLYSRDKFTPNYYKINDEAKIYSAEWPEIYADSTFLALYIVVKDDSEQLKEIRKESKSNMSLEVPHITDQQEFELDDEMKRILQPILNPNNEQIKKRKARQTKKKRRQISEKQSQHLNHDPKIASIKPLHRIKF